MDFLTSIRGLAALLVVFFHLTQYLDEYEMFKLFRPVYANGFLAVDFFFVLSGFIIAFKYQARFSRSLSRADVISFLVKRLARIYPLHLFVLVAYVLLQFLLYFTGREAWQGQFAVEKFLYKLFLVDLWTLSSENWQSWNVPSWTISGEWFAYLVFPLLAFVFCKISLPYRVVTGVFLLAFLVWAYDSYTCGSIGSCIGELGLLRCFGGFVVGVVVYNLHSLLGKGFPLASRFLCVLAAGLFVGALSAGLPNYWVVPLSFSLALLGIVGFYGSVQRILESRIFVYLGDISYSVYLTHAFIADVMYKAFLSNGQVPSILFISIYILVTLVFSSLTYKFIEVPCRILVVDRYSKFRARQN